MSGTQMLRRVVQVIMVVGCFLLLWFNASFYYTPDFAKAGSARYNEDVFQQLRFLEAELHRGAASDMQRLFPEGFVFTNALYGLAALDVASPLTTAGPHGITKSTDTAPETVAVREAGWALRQIDSPRGKRIFSTQLPLVHGVFYRGWRNLLRGRLVEATRGQNDYAAEAKIFRSECDTIAAAFNAGSPPYLESYAGGIWPADNVIAIASLAAYDRVYGTNRYRTTVDNWLAEVKRSLDPTTGLIPHVYYPGQPTQIARGCSQSLIHCFLPEIDSAFAEQQFALYEQQFVTSRLGLPAVREYPKGIEGQGDIDSGPVIWGIGGAASIVGQRAAYLNGRYDLFLGLRNSIESFGVGQTWLGKKRYLFGQLAVADVFIAWVNSVETTPTRGSLAVPWPVHLASLVILALAVYVVVRI